MMTNNILTNVNRNRKTMSIYEQQMSSGKKIQKASENPIIASRALKFRTTISQISQYKTNTEDAMSWLEVTEQSISNTTDILKRVRDLSVQGASDTLTTMNRDSIISELIELKEQLVNEGNVSYAGRYMFTGYQTDSSLVFNEPSTDTYAITESFSKDDIETVKRVYDGEIHETKRVRLGYSELDGTGLASAELTGAGFTIVNKNSSDLDAYDVPDASNTVHFIQDTGELVFNTAEADALAAGFDFNLTYQKSNFIKGDIKPDHYFEASNTTTGDVFSPDNEAMNYQVSYSQTLQVNEMGHDIISKDLVRDLEEIINHVRNIENDDSLEDTLKEDIIGESFTKLIGKMDTHIQNNLNITAKIGGKINRLELTVDRLSSDELNFTDLMSENENVDMAEVLIQFSSMEVVYNASLSASAKIIQPTLLDFIR
jgi:flagellar hook-associated protein 3 FlgL